MYNRSKPYAVWRVQPVAFDNNGNRTAQKETQAAASTSPSDLFVTLPVTADKIEIRWLDKAAVVTRAKTSSPQGGSLTSAEQEVASLGATRKDTQRAQLLPPPPEEAGPPVTLLHEVMHSVGEGIVCSTHILEFTSSSSSSEVSSTAAVFALYGTKARNTFVEGHVVQSWDIVCCTANQQLVRVV